MLDLICMIIYNVFLTSWTFAYKANVFYHAHNPMLVFNPTVKFVQTSLLWLPFPLACGLSCFLPGQPLSPLQGASESIPLDSWCLSSKLKSSIAAQSGALEAEQGKVTAIDFPPTSMMPFNAHQGATQGSTPSRLCPLMINQLWELPACSGLLISSLKSNFHLTVFLPLTFFSL